MRIARFSLLELLVVTLVISTILSLMLPSLSKIFQNSNTLLCQKNLKEIHAFAHSYAADHNNVLPGYRIEDVNEYAFNDFYENVTLYQDWNGHLAPYVDPSMQNEDYHRNTRLFETGEFISGGSSDSEKTKKSTRMIKDTVNGEGPFSVFMCPEVVQSVVEPGVYERSDGKIRITKAFNLTNPNAFTKKNYNCGKGIPVTYTANDSIFQSGRSDFNARKISEVKNYGKKALMIEGGNNFTQYTDSPYLQTRKSDINAVHIGFNMVSHDQFNPDQMHFTFAHDDEFEIWHSSRGSSSLGDSLHKKENYEIYNEIYAPTAYVSPDKGTSSLQTSHTQIGTLYIGSKTFITNVDPNKSTKFLDAYEEIFNFSWNKSFDYIGPDDVRSSPVTGNSNVLFGDGTVKTKHVSWIFTNRLEIFSDY